MRFIIACLCLVALCQGYMYSRKKPAAKKPAALDAAPRVVQENEPEIEKDLSQLLHLLQRIVPTSQKVVPKALPKTSVSQNQKEDLYIEPPMMDPRSFGLDELYRFPDSNIMLGMIERRFTSPEPVYTSMMKDLPIKNSEVFTSYLLAMDSKWNASMNLFKDDVNALPDLFTRMATKFVVNLRFSCPSAFFDTFSMRWSMMQLRDLFASEDNSLLVSFYDEMKAFFTDLPEETVRTIAAEGMVRVRWFINEEMTEYLFGEAFRDVGVFSWTFWSEMFSSLNMPTILPYPNTALPSYRPISDIFWAAWEKSKVRCETGKEVLARYHGIVETFRKRYQQIAIDEVRSKVLSFVADKALNYSYDINNFMLYSYNLCRYQQITIDEVRSKVLSFVADKASNYSYDINNFDETVLMTRIEPYINDIILFFEDWETYLHEELVNGAPNMIIFYDSFKSLEDEPGFVWEMLTRLGLVSGTEPVERDPMVPVETNEPFHI